MANIPPVSHWQASRGIPDYESLMLLPYLAWRCGDCTGPNHLHVVAGRCPSHQWGTGKLCGVQGGWRRLAPETLIVAIGSALPH